MRLTSILFVYFILFYFFNVRSRAAGTPAALGGDENAF